MKNAALMLCQPQDEEYIIPCIKSLSILDNIVITCPTKRMWRERSNGIEIKDQDKTIEYIKSMKGKFGDKIQIVYQDGWDSPQAQWQTAFNKLNELDYKDGDSFIFSMPDEIWPNKDLKKFIELNKNQIYNRTPVHIVYWGTFGYYHITGEGRNYRFEKDLFLDVNNSCMFTYPRHTEFNKKLGSASFEKDTIIHHFKWVHNRKHFIQKADWNNVFYSARPRKDPVELLNEWVNNKSISIQTNLDAAPIFVKECDIQMIELMKKHPYFNKTLDEILDYDGDYIV